MYYVIASSDTDTEKVASSIACGQFLIKLWTYLDEQQIFGSFYVWTHQLPQVCIID